MLQRLGRSLLNPVPIPVSAWQTNSIFCPSHMRDGVSSSCQLVVRGSHLLFTVKWQKLHTNVLSPWASSLPPTSWKVPGKPWTLLKNRHHVVGAWIPEWLHGAQFVIIPSLLDREFKRNLYCVSPWTVWNRNHSCRHLPQNINGRKKWGHSVPTTECVYG